MTVLDILQDYIDRKTELEYSSDDCKPVFIVSYLGNEILLTCVHSKSKITEILNPDEYARDVDEVMENLYNKTM